MAYCKICGKPNCKKHSFLLGKIINLKEFSGSSPPEIFVGRYNYPNINIGILSPQGYGDTEIFSSSEQWHKNQLNIQQILLLRNQLIYGRTKGHIKYLNTKQGLNQTNKKFLSTMQEVAMTHKSISAEFKLKKTISRHDEKDDKSPLITNAAPIENVRLQENPIIKRKVDYITSDTDAKSVTGILELEKSGLTSPQIIKILSAGLLGFRTRRKLVPTRWSITAVDDTISKEKLKKIRFYPEINETLLFHSEYNGNHYEIILLPDKFSFEVIEIATANPNIWQDYEGFFPRKKYAESVTGAYYANRIALTEYLESIKRQATALFFREIKPEYDAPLGVGILREVSRVAFKQQPEKFNTIQEALNQAQTRLNQPIKNFTNKSEILKQYKKQTRLSKWF